MAIVLFVTGDQLDVKRDWERSLQAEDAPPAARIDLTGLEVADVVASVDLGRAQVLVFAEFGMISGLLVSA
jgi:hypothetical protein